MLACFTMIFLQPINNLPPLEDKPLPLPSPPHNHNFLMLDEKSKKFLVEKDSVWFPQNYFTEILFYRTLKETILM